MDRDKKVDKIFVCSYCLENIEIDTVSDLDLIVDHMVECHGWPDNTTIKTVKERLEAVGGFILFNKNEVGTDEKKFV